MVRLKESLRFGEQRVRLLFQFLCGAIEGMHRDLSLFIYVLFQFLCGAIEGIFGYIQQPPHPGFQFL